MRSHLILLAILAPACASTSLTLGPSTVHSQRLGYVSDYQGARVEVATCSGRMAYRFDGSAYDSRKLETGDGHGYRIGALAGYQVTDRITLSAGATFREQDTSAWTKRGIAPRVELEYADRAGLVRVAVDRLDESDDQQTSYSAEVRSLSRVPVFLRVERVEYRTLFASGTGERYEAGLMFRIKPRQQASQR